VPHDIGVFLNKLKSISEHPFKTNLSVLYSKMDNSSIAIENRLTNRAPMCIVNRKTIVKENAP
jgi:hypothetical protein